MKNKKLFISLTTTASFALIGLSAFALFTARDDSDFVAKAGTVDIKVDNLEMANSGNINPGDSDPANPQDAIEGTDHTFEYTVSNLGNKSVRTRHTLILTATSSEDSALLDARYLGLFINNKEIGTKTYVLDDDSEISDLSELKEDQVVKAVKYVYIGDVFDGYGEDIKLGGDAEKEVITGAVKADEETNEVSKTYTYNFSLLRGATNIYQAANFNIDVVIEAMQYRNTDESDWETVTTVSRTYSTADVSNVYVPARDEDSNGEKIDFSTPEEPETSEITETTEDTENN